jgi:hypothetical protein
LFLYRILKNMYNKILMEMIGLNILPIVFLNYTAIKSLRILIQEAKPAHNRSVTASPLKRLGLRKTPVGLSALCGVFSPPHLGQGPCYRKPYICPKRQLQPER